MAIGSTAGQVAGAVAPIPPVAQNQTATPSSGGESSAAAPIAASISQKQDTKATAANRSGQQDSEKSGSAIPQNPASSAIAAGLTAESNPATSLDQRANQLPDKEHIQAAASSQADAQETSSGSDQPLDSLSATTRPQSAGAQEVGREQPVGARHHLDPAQLVERVATSLREAHDSGRQLTVRLSPPELGTLQIDVSSRDGVISARLEAQTETARQTLTDHLPRLREALAHLGATVERIDVHIASPASSGHFQEGERRSRDGQAPPQQQERHEQREQPAHENQPQPDRRRTRSLALDRLNIHV
jgi:flagellar hook-length control protein FliK